MCKTTPIPTMTRIVQDRTLDLQLVTTVLSGSRYPSLVSIHKTLYTHVD